jgi:hypothetical protein
MTISYQVKESISSDHVKLIRQGNYQLEIDNYQLDLVNKTERLNVGESSGNAFILGRIGEEGRKIGILNDCLRFEREGMAKPPISGHRLIVHEDDDNDDDNDDNDDDNDDGDFATGNNANDHNSNGSNPSSGDQLVESHSKLAARVEELEKQLNRISSPVPDNRLVLQVKDLESRLEQLSLPVPDHSLTSRVSQLESVTRVVQSLAVPIVDAGSFDTPYQPNKKTESWIRFSKSFKQAPQVVTSISMADVGNNANFRVKVEAKDVRSWGFTIVVEQWWDTHLYKCTASWVAIGW